MLPEMRTLFWILFGAALGVVALPYLLFRQSALPAGTDLRSPAFDYGQAELLIDRTRWRQGSDEPVMEHEIFDAILEEIEAAETFLIVDFFLWNPWKGGLGGDADLRPLSRELADALIRRRIQNPSLPMLVLTDPINRIYGDAAPGYFQRLAEAGIPVIYTDVAQLPDSNRVYAPQADFWKSYLPTPKPEARRLVPNPFDPEGERLTLAQLGRLLYFKANHRKVLISGRREAPARLIVGSLNPADGSARHSNLALRIDGAVALFAAHSELEVAAWSSARAGQVELGAQAEATAAIAAIRERLPTASSLPTAGSGAPSVRWLSEGAVEREMLSELNRAGAGSRIDAGIFYFSDRDLVEAMRAAADRGATIRILMDANRDAFGREKNGIPNRPVAAELQGYGDGGKITVRWAATRGEQYHAKVLRISGAGQNILCLGSTNWTRRNLQNLNLEANLLIENDTELGATFDHYFESLWTNTDGLEASLPYAAFAETGWTLRWKTWLYRFQEWSGASTF
jgi:phosphatidylserine/phosphatidylglycerophosphate/cardiolipin synthase-like enzyme